MLVKYKIVAGDTLIGLAKRFNTTVEDIRKANEDIIKDVNIIYDGDIINIPDTASIEISTSFQHTVEKCLDDIAHLDSFKEVMRFL